MAGAEIEYSEEERSALKGIFDLYDREQSGAIASSDLGAILEKIGRSPEEAAEMLKDSDPDMSPDTLGSATDATPRLRGSMWSPARHAAQSALHEGDANGVCGTFVSPTS